MRRLSNLVELYQPQDKILNLFRKSGRQSGLGTLCNPDQTTNYRGPAEKLQRTSNVDSRAMSHSSKELRASSSPRQARLLRKWKRIQPTEPCKDRSWILKSRYWKYTMICRVVQKFVIPNQMFTRNFPRYSTTAATVCHQPQWFSIIITSTEKCPQRFLFTNSQIFSVSVRYRRNFFGMFDSLNPKSRTAKL